MHRAVGRGVLSDRWQEAFKGRPRAIISLNLFNGFRLLCNKAGDAEDLRRGADGMGEADGPRGADDTGGCVSAGHRIHV